MKILYINQYFKPPTEPGSTRAYWVAKRLLEDGHAVTMLAHRNTLFSHVGKDIPRCRRTTIDGIDVVYLRNRYANSMGLAGRAWAFLLFMLRSTWHALREKDVDLVIATSTPLTVAFPALMRKWLRGTPFIFEVRDLWPEVPIQMGAVRNRWIVRFLRWFEKTTYRNAVHVVALSPGMREGVMKYIPAEKTSMIPNMAKIDAFWPREKNTELMRGMGLREDSFKVIYFGAMGLSNAIDYIVEAARLLENESPSVDFIFVGQGRFMDRLKQQQQEKPMRNLFLFDRVAMKEMSEIVNFCDLSLVTFTDIPILYTNSPNKLFDSLSAGKPVIVNSRGWTKEMAETHDCGVFVDPSDSKDLAGKIRALRDNPERLSRMGRNARKLAETVYDKSILCEQFREVVERASAPPSAAERS